MREINLYAQKKRETNEGNTSSRMKYMHDITMPELLKYLCVIIAMGLSPRPSVSDYWSDEGYLDNRWFRDLFTLKRFEAIHSSILHCGAPDAAGVQKVQPFVAQMVASFQANFYPFEGVSIDEMVIGWKGRFKHKTYNAKKPKKHHIKTYGLCDSATGYVYDILCYFGDETAVNDGLQDKSSAVKVFDTLLTHLGPGHHVYADR